MPCAECQEVIQDILPKPKMPEKSPVHDPYGWDVVTRQEDDDLVGTVPERRRHDE